MKRIILLVAILGLVQFSFGQAYTQSIDSIYTQSDTSFAPVVYDDYYNGSKTADGVVGFIFTVVDTISNVTLEGGYELLNEIQYVVISNTDSLTGGTYSVFDSNPKYQNYRLGMYGLSGDTATLKDILYFDKTVK